MDIGTGKSPIDPEISVGKGDGKWVMSGVNIWGYDLVDPNEYFSAYDFAQFALTKTEELREEKTVFLVGGTGFYIDAVTGNVQISGVIPDFEVRKELENLSLTELNDKATSLNLDIKNDSERANKQRLIRNIEKAVSQKKRSLPLPYLDKANYVFIGLTADRDLLYSNADKWVREVWEMGLLDEVKYLRDLGYGDSPKMKGLIYGQASDFLDGLIDKDECIQQMQYAMHSYIRRQQTYFKKMSGIKWFGVGKDSLSQNVYNLVESYAR
jgi:tRNA dimethylallyltransferase